MTSDQGYAKASFRSQVRVEEPATRWIWGWRDWATVAMIPSLFLIAWALRALPPLTVGFVDTAVRCAFFALLVVLNAAMLGRHWAAFWSAKWRGIGLVLLGGVVIQVVISGTRALLTALGHDSTGTVDDSSIQPGLVALLFLSLNPVVTALLEDFTFRHTLLMKLPVWRNAAVAALAVIVNALLFGALHINNFGGDSTLIFQAVG